MSSTTSSTARSAPALSRPVAALIGLLSVGAALGVGHLVAGILLEPGASPFLAVGNAAIDRTPGPVKDFAIEQFGTNDKVVLLLGMAVVIALVALVAGLLSRRRLLPGLAAVAVLGLVGLLAVLEQTANLTALLAPVAALVAGAGGVLLANRVDVAASRRAIGALVPAVPAPPIPPNADFAALGTPTFITPSADFYRVDIALQVPQLTAQDATLRITGMVDRELELTFDEIASRPLVERTITMTCVSNFVGGPYVSTSNFIGVPLVDLLDEAGVAPGATQLVGRSVDGFTIGTPLQWVRDAGPDALLAIGMNREPLLPEHGFPMRTVVAGLYGYVSATKWLTELELTTFDFDPYWEERGWDGEPPGIVPIKIQSRVDAPGAFARVPAGPVTFAGIAWAQTRGIAEVEIQLDGGAWTPAELGAEVNIDTWRMWRATRMLDPGLHTVSVRATDRIGELQVPERVGPINPGTDGATGWHAVSFTVV